MKSLQTNELYKHIVIKEDQSKEFNADEQNNEMLNNKSKFRR